MNLLTTAEAARLLGVTADTVKRYCVKGLLPAQKLGKTWVIEASALKTFEPPAPGAKVDVSRDTERKRKNREAMRRSRAKKGEKQT